MTKAYVRVKLNDTITYVPEDSENVVTGNVKQYVKIKLDVSAGNTSYVDKEIKDLLDGAIEAIISSETAIIKSETALANSETAITNSETALAKSETATTKSETAITNSETAITNSENAISVAEEARQFADESGITLIRVGF